MRAQVRMWDDIKNSVSMNAVEQRVVANIDHEHIYMLQTRKRIHEHSYTNSRTHTHAQTSTHTRTHNRLSLSHLLLLSLCLLTLSTLYHFCSSLTSFRVRFVASSSPSANALWGGAVMKGQRGINMWVLK